MNICLIRPPKLLRLKSGTMNPVPPLGLAFIAASLRDAGHDVTVVDAIGESPRQLNHFRDDIYSHGLSYEEIYGRIPVGAEMLGFSMMFTENWLSNRALLKYLREMRPHTIFVAGGEHVSAAPEMCLRQAPALDFCVVGEGEETIVELVAAIEARKPVETITGIAYKEGAEIRYNARRTRLKDIEAIPWPAWDLFPIATYNKHSLSWGVHRGNSLPILATRGCPYSCTFCSSPHMWGTKYLMRSPQDVADEIEHFQARFATTNFDFYDLTAIIRKEWIISFAQEILNRNIKITWQIPGGTRSEAIDREVARYLYLSGCRNITYAPESGSPEILKLIKKKISLSKMLDSMSFSNKEKLNIKINMMLGFPDDRHKNIFETVWFLIQCSWAGVHDAAPSIFSPYPGSALFDRLVNEGKIQLESDEYFYRILDANEYWGGSFYNDHLHPNWLRFYMFLYLFSFYSSNYLFRPNRIFNSIRNVLTRKYESRAEAALAEYLSRKEFKLNESSKPLSMAS